VAPALGALTPAETAELDRLEAQVRAGRVWFASVGAALRAIRNRRLYRTIFPTFEEYCAARWGYSKGAAYRLIAAADVVDEIKKSPIGDTPACEAQARELTRLATAADRAAAWAAAVEQSRATGRPVTAEAVRRQVEARLPPGREAVFLPEIEAAEIKRWLVKRLADWPAEHRPHFPGFVGRLLEQLGDDPADLTGGV
jgi:hypothetical protein